MSAPSGPYVLTLVDITKQLCRTFAGLFTDRRTGKNTMYTMVDAGLSAFYLAAHPVAAHPPLAPTLGAVGLLGNTEFAWSDSTR